MSDTTDWQAFSVELAENAKRNLDAKDDEIDRLKAQLKETEEKGRVLMDMCRDLQARVTKLSEALQVSQQGSVPHWKELEALADECVEGYEFRGDEGDYQPTEQERFLIQDCVAGLMDEVHQMLKRATPWTLGRTSKRLVEALDQCATELAEAIEVKYHGILGYPSTDRGYRTDMAIVEQARALLAELEAGKAGGE